MEQAKKMLVPINLNSEVRETFNSDIVELLGFTHEYLEKTSGVKLPDTVIQLATEIAIQSAKLNHMCQKFDKLLRVEKILEVHRKQVEWSEMISARRAEKTAKERLKIAKSLRGIDKKIYASTGELPQEYEQRMITAFKEFMMQVGERKL